MHLLKRGNLARVIAGLILLLLGLFYAFLPHNIHVSYGLDWLIGLNFSHTIHIILGLILLVAGIIVLRKKK